MDLQYYRTFSEDTSQGIVGLLKPLHIRHQNKALKLFRLEKTEVQTSALDYFFVKDAPTYPIYVFKISKEVNTLIDHEFKISQDIEELCMYLPHFNRILEIKKNIKCYIPDTASYKNKFNPFEKYNCTRDVSLSEYIPSNLTLSEYVKGTNFSGSTDSLIHQLILALFIAQQEKKFTHYDLHLENVLLRRCLQRTFFWYKFLYEDVIINRLVYTDGYFPVLFDYGFAYSQGLEGTSYTNSLFFTNKGYTPFMFDEINDFKTLMVRLAYFKNCPLKFKTFADEKFLKSKQHSFDINRETGWNKTTISSIARIVCKKIERIIIELIPNHYKDNFIYAELDNLVDLFGILIKIPIGQNDFKISTLKETVRTFLNEWGKIDHWFNEQAIDDKLNIIKMVMETINELILEEDIQRISCNKKLNHKFKLKMFTIFDTFGNFVHVKNVNYGQFLSSIIQISNFIEHIVYIEIQRYKKMFNFNMSGWDLFSSIEDIVKITRPYKFKIGDQIVLFDCIEKMTSSFELKEDDIIEALNISSEVETQLNLLDNLQMKEFSEQ
jgi:hypothetical protein